MFQPNYYANLTDAQKDKLRSNIEKIRDFAKSLAPSMEEVGLDYIEADFNNGHCHININNYDGCAKVNGRIGGLYVYFDENEKGYKCDTAAWEWKEYAVSLMKEWNEVKRKFADKIAAQKDMLDTIDGFEI